MLRSARACLIEDARGHKIAEVRKAPFTPIRDRWLAKIVDGPVLAVTVAIDEMAHPEK